MRDQSSHDTRLLIARLIVASATGLWLSGCETSPRLAGPSVSPSEILPDAQGTLAVTSAASLPQANGGGVYHLETLDLDVHFAFAAVQRSASGDAVGTYHLASPDGFEVNIEGRITCMTVDPQHPGRAWMGGGITRNDSILPTFKGENGQVGQDGWFRVVDYGEGSGALQPDRTTRIFFKPAGGFSTAEEFCNGQLWFPEDRLTNALLTGNIQVGHTDE